MGIGKQLELEKTGRIDPESGSKKQPGMVMELVESSAVKRIGYDKETRTVRVEFAKGAAYEYPNVPPDAYTALRYADSVGVAMRTFTATFKGKKVE